VNAKTAEPGAPLVDENADDLARMRFRKAMARKKRKERESEGEIKELNITAMMDIMTIILVFLIKSYATSSLTMTSSDELKPPISTTRLTPKDTVAITITPRHIMVGDKVRATLINGAIDAKDLSGRLIVPVDQAIKKEVEKLKYIAARNPGAPFTHELSVIGDKRIPYDLLLTVLYTAGQNELENYRFIVLTKE
jgi:biopolymer transport protein ExbD